MIDSIYSSCSFIDAIQLEKTTKVAYHFDKMDKIKIISTKSNDHLITKIKYHLTRILLGYHSVDVAMQRELLIKKVSRLFDVENLEETEKKVDALREETIKLTGDKNNLDSEIAQQSQEFSKNASELESKSNEVKSLKQSIEDAKELIEKKGALTSDVKKLEVTKSKLEHSVDTIKKQISEIDHEWVMKVSELAGKPGFQGYREFLESTKSRIIQIFEKDYNNNHHFANSWTYKLFEDINIGGVRSSKQETDFYSRIKDLANGADHTATDRLLNLLKELVQVDYRYHKLALLTDES